MEKLYLRNIKHKQRKVQIGVLLKKTFYFPYIHMYTHYSDSHYLLHERWLSSFQDFVKVMHSYRYPEIFHFLNLKFFYILHKEQGKGTLSRKLQNTGRWKYSALDSRQVSIYWLCSYVLIFLPSCIKTR